MSEEGFVLWQRIMTVAVVLGFIVLAGVWIVATTDMFQPKLQTQADSGQEIRKTALETYQAVQAHATTSVPESAIQEAIKASSPVEGPTDEERRAALEQYLGSPHN